MRKSVFFLAVSAMFFLSSCKEDIPARFEEGPYTVTTLQKGMFDIEDSNSSNPAGVHEGGMNNCSNMYLVLGKKKALLIDLSNDIKWADNAAESLRKVFYDLAGKREKIITITHVHGDHTGMLHAFVDDPEVSFFLPKKDFEGDKRFPEDRTVFIDDGFVFDLGGVKVDAIDVQGHTPGSMAFYVEGQDALFSGDAVGSGSGVWIFSLDGFKQFEKGLANLIAFLENPANGVNLDKLTVYGAHAWQKGQKPKLDMPFIYDLQGAVDDIETAKAVWEPYRTGMPMLNANFKHGEGTITWSTDSYAKLCAEKGIEVALTE